MAALAYLDTHVLVWLYAEGKTALPEASVRLIEETEDLRISPMVRLELQYLHEIGRLTRPPLPVLDALESTLGLAICSTPFPAVIREAEQLHWTRDPFDRIIVAHAAIQEAPLITRDETIHRHYPGAFWDQKR